MAEPNPADDFDYKKLKSDVENRLSKEHELQKIEERSEDCSITVEQWKGIFQERKQDILKAEMDFLVSSESDGYEANKEDRITPKDSIIKNTSQSISDFDVPGINKDEKDFVDPVQMTEIQRSTTHKKLTTNLMTAVFGRKILAESSVTGKGKEGRPALDRVKVELIIGKYKTVWRGLTLMKSPFEVVTYQQMLWDIKPATILEIGSYDGGSALWMADILAMYGCNSHIYSVDIDLSLVNSLAQERQDITFIEGDVNDVEKVLSTELLKSLPHPWFVSEDAHQNVVGVLDYLDRFSEPGDYFIVEDTSPRTPLHDLDDLTKWGRWKLDAVIEFVKKHPTRYRVDKEYTDRFGYNVSCNMNSYLRRI